MTDVQERIKQIRRAHESAKPKPTNPAWCNANRDLGVILKALESQQARIEELEVEVSDLQAFYESVRGWRENDWPSSFCRATAERLSQHGTHAAMQSALRRIGSPAVTDNQVTGQPLAALQTDKEPVRPQTTRRLLQEQ